MLDDARRLIAQGDLTRARRLLEPLLETDTGNAELVQLLGLLEQRGDAQDKAIPLLQRSVELEPGNAVYQNNLGHSFRMSGDLPAARACFDRAIAIKPGFALALLNLGIVLHDLGHFADALDALEQAVRHNPKMAGAMHYLGLAQAALADPAAARVWFETALSVQPAIVESHMELALLEAADDNLHGALARLKQAVGVRADFYPAWRLMAELHVDARDNAAAEQCLLQAQTLRPDDPDILGALGDVLLRQGRYEEALNCFDRTLKLDPAQIRAHGFRADCLERLHRLDEAHTTIEEALALDPDHPELLAHQAGLAQRSGDDAQARGILESLSSRNGLYDDLKLSIHQQLGIVLDRLDDNEAAFTHFEAANEVGKRIARHVDPNGMFGPTWVDMISAWVSETDWAREPPDLAPQARTHAFLVGFPRSGTTLLGQILSAHSAVTTADEQPLLQPFLNRFARDRAALDSLENATREIFDRERNAYDAALLRYDPGATASVVSVDKMPLYSSVMGPIRFLFPESRFIVVVRDPRDACLSCFMQNFQPNPAMARFLELETTVAYYQQIMDLVIRYLEAFPEQIHLVRYEDVVSDLQATATKTLEHLGLGWEEGINEYHEQAREGVITTPSYRQVTQPLYSHAAGRWTRYRPQLEPFLERLQPYAERFGYE